MKEIQWISPRVSYSEHDNAFIMVFIPERKVMFKIIQIKKKIKTNTTPVKWAFLLVVC